MATLQEMMVLADRIGLQGQEVADFIREQQETAREERRLQREEAEKRQINYVLEIARLNNERPANLQNPRNNGKAPKLPSFTDGTDLINSYLMRFERFARANEL